MFLVILETFKIGSFSCPGSPGPCFNSSTLTFTILGITTPVKSTLRSTSRHVLSMCCMRCFVAAEGGWHQKKHAKPGIFSCDPPPPHTKTVRKYSQEGFRQQSPLAWQLPQDKNNCRDQKYSGSGKMFPGVNIWKITNFIAG